MVKTFSGKSKMAVAAAALIALFQSAVAESAEYAILNYSNNPQEVASWADSRFAYKIAGPKPSSDRVKWMTYTDIYGIGAIWEYIWLKDFAKAQRFNYEEMLLHAKKNYTSSASPAWDKMDKFDAFEGKNGVLKTVDGGSFEDLTEPAYSGNVKLSNMIYIGYEEPFAEINMEFGTPGRNVVSGFEYWDGNNWSTLSVSDGTAAFTNKGRINFTPPGNWETSAVNGSRNKYFVRIKFFSADELPVTSKIYGDNWLNGADNACRGWDNGHGGIVNKGTKLAFNPNPPDGASAKFPYQSRITFWSANHFVANPADKQTVDNVTYRTWSRYVADVVVNMAKEKGYSGVMCDDGERDLAGDGIKPEETDFADKSSASWHDENIARYADAVTYVKQINPGIMMGINAQNRELSTKGDWNLAEYNTFVWKTDNPRNLETGDNQWSLTYDDYLPQNNPKGTVGVLIYQDTTPTVPGVEIPWERGNRGPLVALSKHYIGMNEKTVFAYYSRGSYRYDETDEVFMKDGSVLHQSVDQAPPADQVERWATYFPAMGVDIGTPDPNGHNQGNRDLAWNGMWRRDFTNGIVLHRPATWNTTADQYQNQGDSVYLGQTYYPLMADGKTGAGTQTVSLRVGEGAIYLKEPRN